MVSSMANSYKETRKEKAPRVKRDIRINLSLEPPSIDTTWNQPLITSIAPRWVPSRRLSLRAPLKGEKMRKNISVKKVVTPFPSKKKVTPYQNRIDRRDDERA